VIIYVSLSHAGSLYYHIGLIARHLFYLRSLHVQKG
jgi:hypothetical protein